MHINTGTHETARSRPEMTEISPELIAAEEALERFAIAAGQQAEAERIEKALGGRDGTTAAVDLLP